MRVTTGNPVFDKFSGPSVSEYSQQALTEWLAEHQYWEEAASHGRCAGLDEWVCGLAERGICELITSGQYRGVLNWKA